MSKIEKALHELARTANSNENPGVLDSIIGMLDTLVKDGKMYRLNAIIRRSFPEYYLDDHELTDYILGDVVVDQRCYWGEIVEITRHEEGYKLYKIQTDFPEEGCYMVLNRDQFHLLNPELQRSKESIF